MVRGENTSFAASLPKTQTAKAKTASAAPSTDRLELSRQWIQQQEEQRRQAEAAMYQRARKQDDGILGMLDPDGSSSAESAELEALSEQLKVQQKCMKIAANIMAGKRVPPEDEQYLMMNDPEGYKLALAMRRPPKDDEECDSVLDDEDRKSGQTSASDSGEAAPAEGSCEAGASADSGADGAEV